MGNVRLRNLTKRFEDVVAVNDIDLDIADGEFITLVGPSGCGKSTTLEMVAGLTQPTSGTVTIGDRDVTAFPPKDRGIAMVFQNIALFPHMDVYDNISFGLRLRDYARDEIDRRVNRAVEILQLDGMLERMPDELSGGQRQRVAIGRAIVREPQVFLMDEPLANLDAKLRVHMRTEIQRLHKELGTTIIYVTHDQAEAMTMSDRISIMNDGEIQQVAPPLACYNEPANLFVAGFIGSPSMNFMEGEIVENGFQAPHVHLEFDPGTFGLKAGREVTLGIRPEDVYPAESGRSLGTPTAEFATTSDVLEPMGDEIFVYLLLDADADVDMVDMQEGGGGNQLLMSVSPDSDIEPDEQVSVVFDRSKVHLFDTETGDAIEHGLVRPTETGGAAGTGAETDD